MRISDWSSDVCSSDLQLHSLLSRHRKARPVKPCRVRTISSSQHAERKNQPSQFLFQSRPFPARACARRSEEHTSELQSLMRISYAVFCLKKNTTTTK